MPVLKSVSDNCPKTPSRAVKYLTTELEKRDAENEALQSQVSDLTKALASVKLVSQSVVEVVPTEDKKETNNKNKKDKNAPKPAITAYKFYCEDVKSKEGGDDAKTGKELQQEWKEIPGDARQKYVDMAAADKKRFERETAEYEALQKLYQQREQEKTQSAAMALYEAHQLAAKAMANSNNNNDGKKKKKTKDPDAPKRAKSAYMFFCEEKRAEVTAKNQGKSPTEIVKILGEEWAKLNKGKGGKNGTKKFDDMAEKDKARYEKEKATYEAVKEGQLRAQKEEAEAQFQMDLELARKMVESEMADTEASNKNSVAAPTKGKKKDDKPKGPKKAATAYICFVASNREKIKAGMPEGATFAEISAEVGRQWKLMDDKQKKPYEAMAAKDKERYENEKAAMAV